MGVSWPSLINQGVKKYKAEIDGIYTFEHNFFSELRLVDGPSRCQGRLEIRPDSSAEFGQACDNDVGTNEARVICRQLDCGEKGAAAVSASMYDCACEHVYIQNKG